MSSAGHAGSYASRRKEEEMAEKDTRKAIRELQRRINRYIRLTLKDIKTEAKEEFDRNFQRQAFFNEKWKRRRYNQDETRGILQQSGTLRRSIRAEIMKGNKGVAFTSSVPYARIHNEGGTITVTRRMKGWFWFKYREAAKGMGYTLKGELRRNKKNRQLSSDAEFYRAMALKKVGSKIVIPRRQFIGEHPDLEKLLLEIARENVRKVFND